MLFGICPCTSGTTKIWHTYVITYINLMVIVKPCWDRYQNLPKEQKQKLLEYMKKYYLAHKKVKKYIEFLYQVFQELFSFLFYGLVLEILENS